ncbi:MAG: hypothetical protein A3C02_04455 [Candidatus Andersenbacteria bacterium RIFCSPHIGHO2_02_FULL_45_11]|uniref:Methyltransferase domain-containing protein n=1 Tax=Candidatus Andersenbacteria bacterium RIFCSPHIGHO2_12_FULL_45_11 TaxID=1797281 RepID=A0A1G1X411_9BACT|nr:MAG: hypothetical protein A2805_02815 [Candidatus Andersenbacteria bacterium RIFCSPHIGHO2_01_FULL_46_36]OGY32161.1 MAG: hypothetical protein A3C02_04455 [Candidatus Andersenbacteria bacterium RIFCSPHIGHO2_02_FULL_45_11]OGY34310.1 MAG: hypothetical protein A3D99_04555 [Candidatus Andersenbacteria bacterium RIFCSPHIGHO2_12_FULL_45_11]
MSLLDRASDPQQYDKEAIYWEREREDHSPWMDFYKGYILPSIEDIKGAKILDIGSGTGWLLEDVRSRGAVKVVGIEPSERNVTLARQHYPKVQTLLSSFEDYEDIDRYNYIFALMSFVHMGNVQSAMKKVAGLLGVKGSFRMIVPDFDYAKAPRFGYELEVESLTDNEYVARTERPTVTTVDIVRGVEVYTTAAMEAGMSLEKSMPVLPTTDLLQAKPQYEQFRDRAIAQMLWFSC